MTLFGPILDLFLEGVDTFWVVFLSFFDVFENPGRIQAWIFQNWKIDPKKYPLKMPFWTLFGPLFSWIWHPGTWNPHYVLEEIWKYWNQVEKPENAIFDHFWTTFLRSDVTFFDLPEQMPQLDIFTLFLLNGGHFLVIFHFPKKKLHFCTTTRCTLKKYKTLILREKRGPKMGFFSVFVSSNLVSVSSIFIFDTNRGFSALNDWFQTPIFDHFCHFLRITRNVLSRNMSRI